MKFYGCKIYGRKKSIYDKEHEMYQLKDTLRQAYNDYSRLVQSCPSGGEIL